jgi:glycosyltransferase involved in cell wall biosynthesis
MSAAVRVVPLSAILPTRNRAAILNRFIDSLAKQDVLPAELVIVDASENDETAEVVQQQAARWGQQYGEQIVWTYQRAHRAGLAPQRNQAVAVAAQPFVWFLDDDMLLEPGCVRELFDAIAVDEAIGGVTATLINEPYHPPGRATRAVMRWFERGYERQTYASACIGPGWTFMHEVALPAPAKVKAGWLGGGCTIYRKAALNVPAVPDHFEAGALGEDLAASLYVAKRWGIYHIPASRAIHDSQGGSHKRSVRKLADQALRNRWYIMTKVMGKDGARDVLDFAVLHLFSLCSTAAQLRTWGYLFPKLCGYVLAVWKLCRG